MITIISVISFKSRKGKKSSVSFENALIELQIHSDYSRDTITVPNILLSMLIW